MTIYSNFVVMFSHTNYIKINHGGTEKFIKNIQELYNKKGISVVCIFPLRRAKNHVGILIDGVFYGTEKINNIPKLIKKLEYLINNKCLGINIQHLKGFNLFKLEKIFKVMDYKIILAIHDFYFICNTFDFLKNKKTFCGIDKPSEEKCKDCHNYNSIIEFSKNRNEFFKTIDKNVIRVIFPSDFCKSQWLNVFPQFTNRAVVRPHLKFNQKYEKVKKNEKLKVAYIGRKKTTKGIKTWEKIANTNGYEFYYFGIDIDNKKGNDIYVSALTDNEMVNCLRENNIDIVLLWSIIPETYSFTYYEASSAECFIITNENSGNICEQVKNNKNGIVYGSEEKLLEELKNHNIQKKYNVFLNDKQNFSPLNIVKNDDMSYYNFEETIKNDKKTNINIKKNVLSILYVLKNGRTR